MALRVNFRYSLLALLLITTLVCVIVSHWQAHQEVTHLQSLIERQRPVLRKLHDELGVLTVEDPTAVHAIAHSRMHYYQVGLRQDWDLGWRLYLPEPTQWRLCWGFDRLPQTGLPPRRAGSLALTAGSDSQCDVSVGFARRASGDWSASLRHQNIRGSYRIPEDHALWLTAGQPLTWECAGEHLERAHVWTTESFPDGQSIVLLRCMRETAGAAEVLNKQSGHSTFATAAPPPDDGSLSDGILIWIEPIPQEPRP